MYDILDIEDTAACGVLRGQGAETLVLQQTLSDLPSLLLELSAPAMYKNLNGAQPTATVGEMTFTVDRPTSRSIIPRRPIREGLAGREAVPLVLISPAEGLILLGALDVTIVTNETQ